MSDVSNFMPFYPNLLATVWGRAIAFFCFYFIDGVLIAFMATSIVLQMRTRSVGQVEIGFFVGMVYLPASWKWLFGPLVDLCHSERLGRRRGWILGTEALMIVVLLVATPIDFVARFSLFTVLMMLVNLFAAIQRIAVNALACNLLTEQERGTANGMMYAGGYVGQVIGGSGVIYLSVILAFQYMFFIVIGCILAVMIFVAVPLREPKTEARAADRESGLAGVIAEVRAYFLKAYQAFVGSRAAFVGLLFVLIPSGALSLSLAVGTSLLVEFGMSENAKSLLLLISILVAAVASLGGGHLSDWFGRRKMLALCIVGMTLPVVWMAYVMYRQGWIMPIGPDVVDRPTASMLLIVSCWVVTLVTSAFQGLLYATRSALYMDICTPAVAATQFTAYMAMINLTIVYSSIWQGWCVDRIGYPLTMSIDVMVGLISMPLLLLMTPKRTPAVS